MHIFLPFVDLYYASCNAVQLLTVAICNICRAHWYLVVVCFPGLDEPHYVERGGQTLVHDGTENSSDATAQSDSQHDDGDINSGTSHLRDIMEHYQYFSVYYWILNTNIAFLTIEENSSRSNSASGPPVSDLNILDLSVNYSRTI